MAPPKPVRQEKARKPLRRTAMTRGDYEKRQRRIQRRSKARAKALVLGIRTSKNLRIFQQVMEAADGLWSVWVRAKASGCVVCRRPFMPAMLQCAHGWSRTEKATRFEPDNTFAACAHCHRKHTPSGPAWYAWMREHLGDARYERVERMALVGGKLSQDDLRLLMLDAHQRIAALPSGERKAWALERAQAIDERLSRIGVAA